MENNKLQTMTSRLSVSNQHQQEFPASPNHLTFSDKMSSKSPFEHSGLIRILSNSKTLEDKTTPANHNLMPKKDFPEIAIFEYDK